MTSFYYRFHLQKLRAQPYLQAGSKLVAKALLRKRHTMVTRHTWSHMPPAAAVARSS
jgi:hypothetical protein